MEQVKFNVTVVVCLLAVLKYGAATLCVCNAFTACTKTNSDKKKTALICLKYFVRKKFIGCKTKTIAST